MSETTPQPNAAGSACCAVPDAEHCCTGGHAPLLFMFFSAALWLTASSAMALAASLAFHKPDLLAGCPLLTYGRLHPVQLHALAYGFAAQAALGVTLWLLARIGKTRLVMPGVVLIAAVLWNVGVTIGVGGIFNGEGTGYEWLEFPHIAVEVMFIAYVLIALAGVLTYAKRTEPDTGVAPLFLIAGLFWFAWTFFTAAGLLECSPVRGVMQSVVAWWFADNFLFVWFALLGLGAIFYFVPVLAGKPLFSRDIALVTFWVLAIFGSWAGIPAGAPVPVWIPVLSSVGAVLSVVAMLALMVNLKQTAGSCVCTRPGFVPKFVAFGIWSLVLFTVVNAVVSQACVADVVSFTWFTPAMNYLLLQGFVAMLAFGSIYLIVPQLTKTEFPLAGLVKAHFFIAAGGIVLFVVSLAVGGVIQGRNLNTAMPFGDVTKATLPFLRASTTGDLLTLLGSLCLLGNLLTLAWKCCCACCCCCGTKKAEVAP
jgi:cytochrome c oxidase cbb3-type subunit 1